MIADVFDLPGVATQLLKDRRRRDAIFGEDHVGFGEPGWDMLLTLYAADPSAQLTAAELLDAASGPRSTGTRYIEWMVSRDLVRAHKDASAGYSLHPRGRRLMTSYLAAFAESKREQ